MRDAWTSFESLLSGDGGFEAREAVLTPLSIDMAAVGLSVSDFSGAAPSLAEVDARADAATALAGSLQDNGLQRCGCASCLFAAPHLQPSRPEAGDIGAGDFGGPGLNEVPEIPANVATFASVTVGGSRSADIDFAGDRDWIRVSLTAGQTVNFDLVGSGATPLANPSLRLLSSTGSELAANDDFNGGPASRITFTASSTGTYYLETASSGDVGTGGYTLSAALAPPPPPTGSPLDSINWGGNSNRVQGNVIDVYFGKAGDTFVFNNNTINAIDLQPFHTAAYTQAFLDIPRIIPVTFNIVNDAAGADFKIYWGDFGGGGVLGFMSPPGTGANAGISGMNSTHPLHTPTSLAKGGFGYITVVHELGHGLGLAHPHDTGGGSTIMPGVVNNSSIGTAGLNQGVFTMMSYVDGWQTAPWGANSTATNPGFGWQATFMALDIAVLQAKYGANTTWANGNNTYVLPGANAAGTGWESIWDTGGTDTLQYNGSINAVLDLRAATLTYSAGGGGFISYANGIWGGFTIANGVVIENATGGTGNDSLTGNAAANVLTGGVGNDTVDGGAGSDTAAYAGSRSDFHLRASVDANGTLVTMAQGAGGTNVDQIRNVEFLGFGAQNYGLAGVQQNHLSNVDGGRFEDVVFRNTASGQTLFMNMDAGGTATGWGSILGGLPAGWRVFATGDASGDFRADAFVQDTNTGSFYLFNTANSSWTALNTAVTAAFAALDVRDFTGDGTVDVLLRDTGTGTFFIADIGAGGVFDGWLSPAGLPTASWRYVGAADFDRDGFADIAVQDIASGITYYRDINAGSGVGWGFVTGAVGTDWVGRATGDVNGDGFVDVIYQNTATGNVWYVNMAGGTNSGWGVVANGMAGWTAESVHDVDNDGFGDVLLRNSASGQVVFADMNAGVFSAWGAVANPGTGWVVV